VRGAAWLFAGARERHKAVPANRWSAHLTYVDATVRTEAAFWQVRRYLLTAAMGDTTQSGLPGRPAPA
jgi:hypothetical protein